MAEQDLDRAKVGACLKQMRREAVAQGMRMDVLMLKAGAERGLLTGCLQHLGGDGTARRMPTVAGKQPLGGLVPKPAPVSSQRFKQRRTQHHIPILAPLASADVNHHTLAVDVHHLQPRHLCPSRNQRFFCSRLRSALLVERLGMQTRLTPLAFAAASFLPE